MQKQKANYNQSNKIYYQEVERKTERFRRRKKDDLATKKYFITRINSKGKNKLNSYKWRLIKKVLLNRNEGFHKLTKKYKHQIFIQKSTPEINPSLYSL